MLGRIAIWVLIAFVLFTVFRQFDGERAVPAAEQTSYTQFMADAKAGRISRVGAGQKAHRDAHRRARLFDHQSGRPLDGGRSA